MRNKAPLSTAPLVKTLACWLALLSPSLLLAQTDTAPTSASLSAQSRAIASSAMEEAKAMRWLDAEQQVFAATLPPKQPAGSHVRLVVNSRFTEAITLEVALASSSGEELVLTSDWLEPRQTNEIDISEATKQLGSGFQTATVRMSFYGDSEMIQAWLVSSGPQGVFSMPLQNRSVQQDREWVSFWDTHSMGHRRKTSPLFTFHNVDDSPVRVRATFIAPSGARHDVVRELAAKGTAVVQPRKLAPAGRLIAHHDGTPGQVVASAYLSGPRFLVGLPMATPDMLAESRIYDVPRLPVSDSAATLPIVSLHHAGTLEGAAPVDVEVIVLDLSGTHVATAERLLAPGEIKSIDLAEISSQLDAGTGEEYRLQVRVVGDEPILAYGWAELAGDGPQELALIPRQKVHDSGTYPIPSLARHEVTTTIINLGTESAQIFGHLAWEGGDFALEPIDIPAGGAHRLDFGTLAESEVGDIKGRRFQPGDAPAYFQWLSRQGSSDLIARTDVRPISGKDSYGFNCFGCCEEFPYGGIEPEFAAFRVGASADFEPVEFIDTCAGTMGPFHAWPNTSTFSSPLGWNHYDVWAGSHTEQTVSFQDSGSYTWITCTTRTRTFFGDGPVVADEECQEDNHPEFDPSKGCCGMHGTNVQACKDCCEKERDVAHCRCDALPGPFESLCEGISNLFINLDCIAPCQVGCGNA